MDAGSAATMSIARSSYPSLGAVSGNDRSARKRPSSALVFVCLVFVTLTLCLLSVGSESSIHRPLLYGSAIFGTLAFYGFVTEAPREWLLAAALSISVLLPNNFYNAEFGASIGNVVQFISPSFMILLACFLLPHFQGGDPSVNTPPRAPGSGYFVVFAAYAGATLALADSPYRGAVWLVTFGAVVLLPMVAHISWNARSVILRTWLMLGTTTGLYAIVERLMGRNVLFAGVYDAVAQPAGTAVQHWSDYRSQASFGHPIYAGMFFAVTACMAFLMFFDSRRDRRLFIVGLIASVALICTGTRGAIIGLGFGLTLGLLPGLKRQSGTRLAASVFGISVAFAALISIGGGDKIWQGVIGRFGSQEAAVSAGGRQSVVDLSLKIAEQHSWMGAGAGTSRSVFRTAGSLIPVESGPLQVLVSVGIPGLLLISLGLLSVGYALWRSTHGVELGMLVTAVVCLAGFNGFEDVPTTMTWLGISLFTARCALCPPADRQHAAVDAPSERSQEAALDTKVSGRHERS